MSNKDFKKGMEAGARPFAEKFKNYFDDLKKSTEKINEKFNQFDEINDTIIDGMNSIEKKQLYDLNTLIDIKELGEDEKEILMAVLYTISNSMDKINEYQQLFIRSVKEYLEIYNPPVNIDLMVIDNVENLNDQKAILQVVMEFLFLSNSNHTYMDENKDIIECFSINRRGKLEIQNCIDVIYKATGLQGIAEKYGYIVEEDLDGDSEEDIEENQTKTESYDGRDICEKCADIVNINSHVVLKDYIVYWDDWTDKVYRVNKENGQVLEMDLEMDLELTFTWRQNILSNDNSIFIVKDWYTNELISLNVNTLETNIFNLSGDYGKKFQCNNEYIIYNADINDERKMLKFNLEDKKEEVIDEIENFNEYYILDDYIYVQDYEQLFKYNLKDNSISYICEYDGWGNDFLNQYNTNHYKNILFSINSNGNEIYDGELDYSHMDLSNPLAVKKTNIKDSYNDLYAFIGYEYIFYVVLDYYMSIRKYNINTGENLTLLESTNCADSRTEGIFRKKNIYYIVNDEPQVVGRWLYYLGRGKKNVRKVSIDVVDGKSEEVFIDGEVVSRDY